jgi:ferredoxin
MKRKIIRIDEEKCTGCGICKNACHEGAIEILNGKAKLVRENFCDGFGDCLPACPAEAISFEEREAAAYDENAVMQAKQKIQQENPQNHQCPGAKIRQIKKTSSGAHENPESSAEKTEPPLSNWPVQIKLAPVQAEFYSGAKLLIAADCTAYAFASFHQHFLRGKVALIGCPKLDSVDYTQKLTSIIAENNIKSVMIVRMEVPCCGGLERAAKDAIRESGKFIPWQVATVGINGAILDE